MSPDWEADHLPVGLPAPFTSGKEGLRKLQKVLGIPNRRELQSILHVPVVRTFLKPLKSKFRGLKTSQRLEKETIAFYSDPIQRRLAWELCLGTSEFNEIPIVPSLEYEAMKIYNPRFMEIDIPPETIDDSLAIFGDYSDWDFSLDHEIPVFHVWPDLWHDLLHWTTLSSDRQEAVGLATFAVATVLDDSRFLAWAASHVERLGLDFAFALKDSSSDFRVSPAEKKNREAGIRSYASILEPWSRNCELIIDVAKKLKEDPPKTENFDDLFRPIDELRKLRDPLESAIKKRDRVLLIDGIEDTISSCVKTFDASWIASVSARVSAQWKLEYMYNSEASEEVVEKDVERFKAALNTGLRDWRRWEDAKGKRKKELEEFEFRATEDLARQLYEEDREVALHETMAEAARRANHGKRQVLRALAPEGKFFESTRDYERELSDAEGNADRSGRPSKPASSGALQEDGTPTSAQEGARAQGGSQGISGEDSQSEAKLGRVVDEEPPPQAGKGDVQSPSGDSGDNARTSLMEEPAGDGAQPLDSKPTRASTVQSLSEEPNSAEDRAEWEEEIARNEAWYSWLRDVGDPDIGRKLKVPNLRADPKLPSVFSFKDPTQFANSLNGKVKNGGLANRRLSFEKLASFLYSDPRKGHPDWYPIYRAILRFSLNQLTTHDSYRHIAFLMVELMLRTYRNSDEYRSLVDAALEYVNNCTGDGVFQSSIELSELFLGSPCKDREYLVKTLLDTVIQLYSTERVDQLPPRLRKIAEDLRGSVREFREESRSQVLSSFLSGKRMLIYTLQTTTAKTLKTKLEMIEPSIKIRLLDNAVWNDSLANPVRNADICLIVKSASKHNMIDMISRVRNEVGKEVLEPSSKGVESAMREIYRAAGLDNLPCSDVTGLPTQLAKS